MVDAQYFTGVLPETIAAVLPSWKQSLPDGICIALVAEKDATQIPALQALFNREDYPLLGAMFPQLIVDGQFKNEGVILLALPDVEGCGVLPDLDSDPEILKDQLTSIYSAAAASSTADCSLFLVFDAMVPNISSVLDTLYLSLANSVHYFGVNAGSETFQPKPCLFDNQCFVGNGLLYLLMRAHDGAVLSHNYQPPRMYLTATSTEGNRIDSIEWRPAFEVYREVIKERYAVEITAENFYQYGVHFPFGIARMDGEPLVRIPVALQADGSLFCVGEIPPNSMLTLVDALNPGMPDTVDTIAGRMRQPGDAVLLNFYCAGRRMHMGCEADRELLALSRKLRPGRLYGALSLGEIGSSAAGGYPLFHNAAILVAAA